MKTTMDRSLVIDAMRDAIRRRRATSGTIFHSDRGRQYASEEFRGLLESCGLKPSMSRKGGFEKTSVTQAEVVNKRHWAMKSSSCWLIDAVANSTEF